MSHANCVDPLVDMIFISYAYYETVQSRQHLLHFLENGLDENVHLVINCKSSSMSVDVSTHCNVYLYKSENLGHDFGAHKETLNMFSTHLHTYRYFVLMNDTCVGPFTGIKPWYKVFTDHIHGEVRVSCPCRTGIMGPKVWNGQAVRTPQTSWGGWFACMDYEAMQVLLTHYNQMHFASRNDAHRVERMNGKWILDAGFEIHGLYNTLRTDMKPQDQVIVKRRFYDGCMSALMITNEAKLLPEMCVIILRCARNANHNRYAKESIACIRKHDQHIPIFVVDDHSTEPVNFNDAELIQSDLEPGRGEVLPYYYLMRHRLAKRALIIHDSVFAGRCVSDVIASTNQPWTPLWHALHSWDHVCDEEILNIISGTRLPDEMKAMYKSKAHMWDVCFGAMGIVSLDFLCGLEHNTGIVGSSLQVLSYRNARCGFERALPIAIAVHTQSKHTSKLGSIAQQGPQTAFDQYLKKKESSQSRFGMVKVWTGR